GIQQTASCPAIMLTPAGEAASAHWTRRSGTSGAGTEWTVPIGRRELVGVTGFTTVPDGSTEGTFDWKWTPNETGTALRTFVPETDAFFQPRTHRASCRPWDDSWRCEMKMWRSADEGLGLLSPTTFRVRP